MQDRDEEGTSNPTTNPAFADLVAARIARRQFVGGGLGAMALGVVGCADDADQQAGNVTDGGSPLTFAPIAPSSDDAVRVPEGYEAQVLVRWGDPIGATGGSPAFEADASNTAEEQRLQFGMHHDGMSFFPLYEDVWASEWGLVAVNHEYIDPVLLLGEAFDPQNAEHVNKCKAAHGVSIYETDQWDGQWFVVPESAFARRITLDTPMEISGPARGHAMMQTNADPSGTEVLGTVNNCSNGQTPWGTYLTCEENFNGYFKKAERGDAEKRYGIYPSTYGADFSEVDPRFDLDQEPNEANRFGWIVEIDPFAPDSPPKKRTALGRFKHENAAFTVAPSGQVVVYMGDDERNEYIYKFVSSGVYVSAKPDMDILDQGTLYVARFDEDGQGEWLPLVHGQGPLVAPAFADQGEVLVHARRAADAMGATKMDRPEWVAVNPQNGDVYCTLTNNSRRGGDSGPAVDAANPRPSNSHGHIVRWREADADPTSTAFTWDLFVLAGDPNAEAENERGNIAGDLFSAPDGLAIDPDGMVWIQTDVSTSKLYHPELNPDATKYQPFGNNQLLAVDPAVGEVKRFLTGPVGAEVTGFALTPDQTTLFVNIQHPGESLGSSDLDPQNPKQYSSWPEGEAGGRPRSATLAIRRKDGGKIGG